jgi:hypothetical protein
MDETAPSTQPQFTLDNPLYDLPKEDVERGYREGVYTDREVDDYILVAKLKQPEGIMGLSKYEVEDAMVRGLVSDSMVDAYIAGKSNPKPLPNESDEENLDPKRGLIKDTLVGVLKGGRDVLQDGFDVFLDLWEWHTNQPGNIGAAIPQVGDAVSGVKNYLDEKGNLPAVPEPQRMSGKIAEPVTEIAALFVGAGGKAAKAMNVGQKMLFHSPLSHKLTPRAAKFMTSTIDASVAGMVGDFAYDPKQEGIADFLDEMEILPDFFDFLKTDPEDTTMETRFKRVIEGGIVGVPLGLAVDGVVSSVKAVRHYLKKRAMDNPRKLMAAINEWEMAESAKRVEAGKPSVTDERAARITRGLPADEDPLTAEARFAAGEMDEAQIGVTGSGTAVEGGGGGTRHLAPPRKSPKAQYPDKEMDLDRIVKTSDAAEEALHESPKIQHARKVYKDELGHPLENNYSDDLLEKLEARGDVHGLDIMEAVFRQYGKQTVSKSHKVTQREANKVVAKVAEITGGEAPEIHKALGVVKEIQGNLDGVTSAAKAAYDMFHTYGRQLDDMAEEIFQKTQRGESTFAEKLKFREHIAIFAEMQEAVYGIRSEFGRGLNMHNMKWKNHRFDFSSMPLDEMKRLELSESTVIDDMISTWRSKKGLKAKARVARNMGKSKILQGVLELEQMSLLSAPYTQLVNIEGTGLLSIFRRVGRHAANAMEMAVPGQRKEAAGEMLFDLEAMRDSLFDLFRVGNVEIGKPVKPITQAAAKRQREMGTFWKTLWTGESQIDQVYRFEGQGKSALDDWKINMNGRWGLSSIDLAHLGVTFKDPKEFEALGRIFEMKGVHLPIAKLMRFITFNALTAGDELFRNMAQRHSYYRDAYRLAAKNAGGDPMHARKYARQILKEIDPDLYMRSYKENINDLKWTQLAAEHGKDIQSKALKMSREDTLSDDLGMFGKNIDRAMNSNAGLVLKIMEMPFFKVLVNIPKVAVKNSALGALSGRVWKEVFLNKECPLVDKLEVINRMLIGTSMFAAGAAAYEKGIITGRMPKDQYENWNQNGVGPYSVLTRDDEGNIKHAVQYDKWDPAALWWGGGADFAQAWDIMQDYQNNPYTEWDIGEVVMAFAMAATEPLFNKQFGTSLKDTARVVTDPERMNGEKWLGKQVAKFMPRVGVFFHDVTADEPRVLNETRDMREQWYAWMDSDKALPRRHSVYGTIQTQKPRWYGHRYSEVSDDPVDQELFKIGANIRPMSDKYDLNGERIELTPEQYEQVLRILESQDVKGKIAKRIASKRYQTSENDYDKAELIRQVVTKERTRAKRTFHKSPLGSILRDDAKAEAKRKRNASRGKGPAVRHKTTSNYQFMKEEF